MNEIVDFLDTMPCEYDEKIAEYLSTYLEMLYKYNKTFNLVGFTDKSEILWKLISDSFHLAVFLNKIGRLTNDSIIWEPGAGGGLPGIPLRILWQKGFYTMIERREKRVLFLENVLCCINLPNTNVFHGSIEDFFRLHQSKKADCIISRAFKPWSQLLNLCAPSINDNGMILILASNAAPDNLNSWQLIDQQSYVVANKERFLWAVTPKPQS